MLAAWLLTLSAAAADPLTTVAPVSAPSAIGRLRAEDEDLDSTTERRSRQTGMELNARVRWLSVPRSVLDIWYFNEKDPGANPFPRPRTSGFAVGAEYGIVKAPTNWIFYLEYMSNLTDEGYWDDVEDPGDHEDGDWVRFDNFGIVAVGVNYGHEVMLTHAESDLGFSLVVGGGIGVGFVTGQLTQWHAGSNETNTDPGCLPGSAAYERYDTCTADGKKRLPSVLPIVDITLAAKIRFAERAHIRIEGGLHDMLYAGGAVGTSF